MKTETAASFDRPRHTFERTTVRQSAVNTTAHLPTVRCEGAERTAPPLWLSVAQLGERYPAFTEPAIRSLIRRSRPHYNHRGEWVEGNGLAPHIRQLGGKNGKVLVDEIGFARWLEDWVTNNPRDDRTAA
jgi:hypothetical protein